jgi:DNA recombination protein Rad52
MAFTEEQRRALQSKLSYRHVKTRSSNGTMIPYVEGWHVIAEANRIFGYDCWDRKTIAPRCVWSELERGQTVCFYTTKVRVTVRAGGDKIEREGIGTGIGRAAARELAHEIALKTAETDATKRALSTFGNPFGLALYDKEKSQVTKSPRIAAKARNPSVAKATPSSTMAATSTDLILVRSDRESDRFENADDFVAAVLKQVPLLPTIEALYAFWEANIDGFRALRLLASEANADPVIAIISVLKARARMLGGVSQEMIVANGSPAQLAIPKEKRIRSKEHLVFVAKQPCLVCGRRPAQAHHLRFAQPRAMALKVSDEFTVPLCSGHHDSLHRTGDERAWWARNGIRDPLMMAGRLWAASRLSPPGDAEESIVIDHQASGMPANVGDSEKTRPAIEES